MIVHPRRPTLPILPKIAEALGGVGYARPAVSRSL